MRCLLRHIAVHSILLLLASAIAQAATPGPQRISSPAATDNTIRAVTNVADGQAGYVHYFLIIHPDGTPEDQVGIELEDQRIAWSFPDAGVIVSGFIKNGRLDVAGKTFAIEHLHGIRPFRTAGEMQALRSDLARRVAYWVDEETPYCIFRRPGEQFCLNCGDFVARILFPATNTAMVALPKELTPAAGNMLTSDDLLLYMLGLHTLPDVKSRLERLATLDVPESLRMDVTAILQPDHPTLAGATNADQTPAKPFRLATRRPQNRRL